jgi:hypothetical protein
MVLLTFQLLILLSCENPMVNFLLGKEKEGTRGEWIDTSPVALWNGDWYYSLKEAVDAAVLTGTGTAASPSEIEIRRNITRPNAMGAGEIVFEAGEHVLLKPYASETSLVLIQRWQGGPALFTVKAGASLTLDSGISMGGAGGQAVYVEETGTFTMKAGSRIRTEADVYLKTGAMITLDGSFPASPDGDIARISPELPYPPPGSPVRQVLAGSGTDILDNHNRFDVTPDEAAGWPGPRYWRVDKDGFMLHMVARRYTALGALVWYPTLQDAVAAAAGSPESPDEITIISNIDFGADDQVEIGVGKYIRFTVPEGMSYGIKRTAVTEKNMFRITGFGILELGAPSGTELIIDGGAEWSNDPDIPGASNGGTVTSTQALVYVTGNVAVRGTFRLTSGAVLRNNDRISGEGGAVETYGEFSMTGGLITRNRTVNNGGGIYIGGINVSSPPVKVISGGSITHNDALLSGGGVSLDLYGHAKLTMTGGLIGNNRANSKNGTQVSSTFNGFGGGVFIPGNNVNNEFNMRGGSIRNNVSASGKGNGIAMDRLAYPVAILTMQGSVDINGDIHLQNHYMNDCVINVTDSMTVQSPLLITMDALPGSSKKVLTGSFNLVHFEAQSPQTLSVTGAAGYINTP